MKRWRVSPCSAGGRYLDGTFGRGGHARAVLSRLGPDGRLLLMDRDPQAIAAAQAELCRRSARVASATPISPAWPSGTKPPPGWMACCSISACPRRSWTKPRAASASWPMRRWTCAWTPRQGESAAEFLARADEREITEVLWHFGEERHGRRIARAIVADRDAAPFTRTGQLAALIERVVGRREPGKHPATRSFQALRIQRERRAGCLAARPRRRARIASSVGGRLSVISFHSLEDRAVKLFIRDHARPRAGQPPRPAGGSGAGPAEAGRQGAVPVRCRAGGAIRVRARPCCAWRRSCA